MTLRQLTHGERTDHRFEQALRPLLDTPLPQIKPIPPPPRRRNNCAKLLLAPPIWHDVLGSHPIGNRGSTAELAGRLISERDPASGRRSPEKMPMSKRTHENCPQGEVARRLRLSFGQGPALPMIGNIGPAPRAGTTQVVKTLPLWPC